MKKASKRLGELETQFFAYTQLRKKSTVSTGNLVSNLAITEAQERKLLFQLCRSGLIARLKRGLYLVPPRIPAGGKWGPDEFLILSELMKALGGRYQVCGPTAFHFYGFDEQIPNRVYVYNNKIYGDRNIGGTSFTFIKTSDERLGGVYAFKTPEGVEAVLSSKSRTLVDAVYDWSRFNTIPRSYNWIRSVLATEGKLLKELIEMTLKYGNQGTIRRIGYLLETMGIQKRWLNRLRGRLSLSSSLIPWIPGISARGKIVKKWGLIVNEP